MHCQRLMPILDQLGVAYTESDDVIVAKVDVTEDEMSSLAVDVVPTIRLYLKNSNEVIKQFNL